MINIIDQYQATLAASDLSTPSGKAATLAAANQANTEGSGVMQELQGNLGSQAGQVSAIGAPVGVTDSPTTGASTTAGNTLLSNPINWLLGPTGLPGAFNAVVNDPRLTPEGIAEDFMNLLFLPTTVTELNQGIDTTNQVIGRTNTIMTGLNGTLGTTNREMNTLNGTLGTTNTYLQPLPGALANATYAIGQTTGAVNQLDGNITGTDGQPGLEGDLNNATTGIDRVGTELQPNSAINKNLHAATGAISGTTNELHTVNHTLEPISSAASDADRIGHDLNPLNW
jgi:hypothetical protein